MNGANIWTIATKNIGIFLRKRGIYISILIIPFIFAIGLPLILFLAYGLKNVLWDTYTSFFDAFSFFFVILGALIPNVIGAYSFVGEKVEKTLEPLLATPATDTEILLGKSLAAFLPCICLVYLADMIFALLMDIMTSNKFGNTSPGQLTSLYFPNWNYWAIALTIPLACILSIEFCVIVSSRATDARTSQQLSGLSLIPYVVIYVLTEVSVITLNYTTLLEIAGIIAIVDVILYFTSRRVFEREEILTPWK